jgi:hypothetical protein
MFKLCVRAYVRKPNDARGWTVAAEEFSAGICRCVTRLQLEQIGNDRRARV